jgi:hypothetical protein
MNLFHHDRSRKPRAAQSQRRGETRRVDRATTTMGGHMTSEPMPATDVLRLAR